MQLYCLPVLARTSHTCRRSRNVSASWKVGIHMELQVFLSGDYRIDETGVA
jgi:hypothetical protein